MGLDVIGDITGQQVGGKTTIISEARGNYKRLEYFNTTILWISTTSNPSIVILGVFRFISMAKTPKIPWETVLDQSEAAFGRPNDRIC